MPVDPSSIPVNPGWTYSATIGAVQTVLIAVLGGGGVWGIFRGIGLLWKQSNETKKLDNDAAISLRKEMAEITERQQKRIDGLEDAGREDRKRFDDEMTALRKSHAAEVAELRGRYEVEIRGLRDEIAGYHRQLIAWQQASGKAVSLPPLVKPSADVSDIGEVLNSAFPVRDVGNG